MTPFVEGVVVALTCWLTARAFAWAYYLIERLLSGD